MQLTANTSSGPHDWAHTHVCAERSPMRVQAYIDCPDAVFQQLVPVAPAALSAVRSWGQSKAILPQYMTRALKGQQCN